MCSLWQQRNWRSVRPWVNFKDQLLCFIYSASASDETLKNKINLHTAEQQLYFSLFLFRLRRCLTSFWMRTSWRMRANTWQSTWRLTGGPRAHRLARRSTRCWDATWAPPLCPHIPLLFRWTKFKLFWVLFEVTFTFELLGSNIPILITFALHFCSFLI